MSPTHFVEEFQELQVAGVLGEVCLEDPEDAALQQDVVVASNHTNLCHDTCKAVSNWWLPTLA